MSSSVIGALRVDLGLDTAAFSDGLKRAQSRMANLGASLKAAAVPIAGAVTAAFVGVGAAVNSTISAADEMHTVAQKIGIPIAELGKLKFAAEQSGVGFDSLQSAFGIFAKNMADAAKGTGPAVETFKALGVELTNADGSLRSSSDVFSDLAEAFAKMPEGAGKSAEAMRIFGESGRNMVPLLNEGREGISKLKEEASTFGQVFTEAMGAQADTFRDNMDKLKGAFGNVAADLTEKLLPYLVQFSEWMVQNGPALAEFIGNVLAFGAEFVKAGAAVVGFVQALGDAAERAGIATRAIGSAIIEALAAIPSQMAQIGRDIIDGLIGGLRERWEAVKSTVTGLASSVVEWFKTPLDSHSPSRVFVQIGRDVMAGLRIGLEGNQGAVQRGMEGFAQSLAGQFEGILSGATKFSDALRSIVTSGLAKAGSNLISAGAGGLFRQLFKGLPGFANGTSFAPGGLAWVGERGRELVNLPRGAHVIPNHELGELGGQSVVLNYHPVIDARGADAAAIARLEARMNAEAGSFRDKVMQTIQDPRRRGRF